MCLTENYKNPELLRKFYSEENLSLSQISRMLSISRPTLTCWIKRYGIRLRPKIKCILSREELEDLYINKRLSTLKIAKIAGVSSRNTIRRKLIKFKIPLRSQIEVVTKYKKTPFSGNKVEEAYLIGFRLGDLHACKVNRRIRVSTTTTHPSQIQMMKDTFRKYSHAHHYYMNGRCGYKEIIVYSYLDRTFEFLLGKPDKIQEWIINNDEYFLSFLAGFMDSEGCWYVGGGSKGNFVVLFQLSNTNEMYLKQIKERLKQFGIKSDIVFDRTNNTNHYGYKRVYDLQIRHKDDIFEMAEKLLPFSKHYEKIRKMKLILKTRNNKKWVEIQEYVAKLRQIIKEEVNVVKSGKYGTCEPY